MISLMRLRVEVSIPLERETTGTSGGMRCATFSSAAREYWHGTAWKMKSASAKAASGSSVAVTLDGSSRSDW